MNVPGNGQLSVPPGFRFHPTEEELLYYYLKKKVSYEAIDLDVIREVDLNKLEPWDLKERCRIGSGPQNEWYFFSHKDKKYPTGTRTNRATAAGFWKATGRDKAIYYGNANKRIGMRKTLVFYTGRAPHGQKTDWIMHEYRLDDDDPHVQQEDGWVVCRVFKKKNNGRGIQQDQQHEDYHDYDINTTPSTYASSMKSNINNTSTYSIHPSNLPQNYLQPLTFPNPYASPFDTTIHLPQLSSPDSLPPTSTLLSTLSSAQQLLTGGGERLVNGGTDQLGFLDKLLSSYQSLEEQQQQQQERYVSEVASYEAGY
ncbi:hypothetical protein Cgig2_010152 [Carnegiea gigantea]|uniref:NAC domain-containing protein n=1 Tax=Carnegiea gigantea TaxID=171969 RepID=A0A9Q1KHC6_9CARY|nr:hypothetical protein Cgig2_010152 [Carnegiea gigantea]